jgi:hypothetical protein
VRPAKIDYGTDDADLSRGSSPVAIQFGELFTGKDTKAQEGIDYP